MAQENDQKWRDIANNIQKAFYLSFDGTQWHQFNKDKENNLLLTKICCAMYGPPETAEVDRVEDAYTEKLRKTPKAILNTIFQVHEKSKVKELRVGFIFICCKQEENEFVLPLFSVFVGADGAGNDKRCFVDLQCRTYTSWDDWKKNNVLPQVMYAYPTRGFYTCSGDSTYTFDIRRSPDVEFGNSPACKTTSKILDKADVISSTCLLGAGVILISAFFTPIAPVVLRVASVAVTSAAVYGTARDVSRLADKGRHGESLVDFESLNLWLSIASTPLQFTSSVVNAMLSKGAQEGRILSTSMRTLATVLNLTTLGADSVMFISGLSNIIKKTFDKELTPLEFLQFSVSAFFFTNTLMQPKVAKSIIQQAQTMNLHSRVDSMSDEAAKKAFEDFLKRNRGDGGIKDTSKIIRAVNKLEDPSKFFKSLPEDSEVFVGGRKGRTFLVSDSQGHMNRINPNRTIMTKAGQGDGFKFNKDFNRLKKCYGKDPNEVELNGKKIFQNMSERDQRRVGKVFNGSANCDPDVIRASHAVAESLGLTTADDLMNVIEIVVAEVKGKSGVELTGSLQHLTASGKKDFIHSIETDIAKAMARAKENNLSFESPLLAVYHFRKHGPEFAKILAKMGGSIDVYLDQVSHNIFKDSHLKEVCDLKDGIVRKIFATKDDYFGVLTVTPRGVKISTMFHRPGYGEAFTKNLIDYFKDSPDQPGTVSDAAQRLARILGLPSFPVYITKNGKKELVADGTKLDADVQEEIAHYLNCAAV